MAEPRHMQDEYSNEPPAIMVSDDEDNDSTMQKTPRLHGHSEGPVYSSQNTLDRSAMDSRPHSTRPISLDDVYAFLRANNLTSVENVLRQESPFIKSEMVEASSMDSTGAGDVKHEPCDASDGGTPTQLPELYKKLVQFVERTDSNFRPELHSVLPATFMHVYINILKHHQQCSVENVYDTYISSVPQLLVSKAAGVKRDLTILRRLRKPEDVRVHPLFSSFVSSKYIVSVSRSSYEAIKTFLVGSGNMELVRLMADNICFDKDNDDRKPRTLDEVLINYGALLGDVRNTINKQKV